jgi:dTDP-4-amino-4,6-dideoxygalactose transaminase
MRELRMVDLVAQYEDIQEEVDNAVKNILTKASYINGPDVKSFQSELEAYLDVPHVIPCANGTDALQVAMMALDLQPGDEVITASFTYVATAEVIALLKLKPVLVDVDPDTFLINPEQVKAAITPKTKAIVPVHLFGQSAPMEELMQIAKEHNLFVIEDTAQAIGSDYSFKDGTKMKAGTIGDIGATSFFPSKNLGCYGDGGALFTRNEELAKRLRMIVNHGQSKRYYHDDIGVNSRLDTLQAAVLRIKLRRLNEYSSNRQKAAAFYDKAFEGIIGLSTPKRATWSNHVFHQYTLKVDGLNRDALVDLIQEKGVPCMIYYPVPLHHQKAYRDDQHDGKLSVTEKLCTQVFSLPMHTHLDDEQLNFITNTVKSSIEELKNA